MISSRREDRTSGAAAAEAPARPLLRDQLRPHRRQTFHPGARRRRRRRPATASASPSRIRTTAPRPTRRRWHIISEFIAPRVLGVEFAHPRELFPALKAIRGHNMAKAAVEMAAWDLYAQQRGEPLAAVLGGTRDAHRLGRVDRHPGLARRSWRRRSSASSPPAIGGSRSRSSRAGTSTPVRDRARTVRRHPADGRRQRRLHARRRAITSRSSIAST